MGKLTASYSKRVNLLVCAFLLVILPLWKVSCRSQVFVLRVLSASPKPTEAVWPSQTLPSWGWGTLEGLYIHHCGSCYVTDTCGGREEGMMPLRKDLGVCSSFLFPPASHCPFLPWASLPSSRGSTHGTLCRAWRVAASHSHCVLCPLHHILKPMCSFPGAEHTGRRDGPATCSGTSCRVKNRGLSAPENKDRLPGGRKDHTPGTRAAGN